MRNIRSQGSFTNLTNAKHLTDMEKRKKGEAADRREASIASVTGVALQISHGGGCNGFQYYIWSHWSPAKSCHFQSQFPPFSRGALIESSAESSVARF